MTVSTNLQKSNAFSEAEAALKLLASSMGAAVNIATASLLNTPMYRQTSVINDQMVAIANDAEHGKLDLERTIKISEAIFHLNAEAIKHKSMNPLIPDTLIAILNSAVNYAEKAQSLIRAALQPE